VVLALLAALLPSHVPARASARVQPGLGIRLLEAPENRRDDPRALLYVVDRVAPGATFTRKLEVTNGDPTAMDVLLYAAPATIAGGNFTAGPRGEPGLIPQWVSVTPASVHLEPGSRATLVATFRVPAGAPAGEVYGAIMAERPAQPSRGVSVALRAGVRVYLSVGPGGEPASDFTVDTLTAERDAGGRPRVVAQVHNTGGRALDMSGTLKLSQGPGGLSAGPFPASLGTTLGIGQTEPVTVLLDRALPDGPWLATLDLRSGLLRRRVQGTILFPSHASASTPPVHPRELPLYEKKTVVVPVAATLIGLVSLALLVLALLAWRRRREEEDEEEDGAAK
jgi:hypothetical protein